MTGRRISARMTFLLAVRLLAFAAPCGSAASELRLVDLAGNRIDPLRGAGQKATVLIFTRTDCPISNRYAPVIEKLDRRFGPKGISFWLVYIDPHQSLKEVRHHFSAYGYHLHAAFDPEQTLVKIAGAKVTPEAAVFSSEGLLLYHGRIDNSYVDVGQRLPAPTRDDLELTLDAILAGKQIPQKTTEAVGCYISDLE